MAEDIIRITAEDGSLVEFVKKEDPPSGAMKYVYFSPQKDYVVAFFKNIQNAEQRARLKCIVGKYRHNIFENAGGDFWKELFCWPEKLVEYEGALGVCVPAYASNFFFPSGPEGKRAEKQGKWFASAKLLRVLDEIERGNFYNYLRICLKLSQAVRRLHLEGLAHSDLSYKNVLIDPSTGKACIIDIDGLVVPDKYSPDVLGTPDFIAPEVISTQHLPLGDPKKVLPSHRTDLHALAVLIYMYLLHRHPLRGGRYFGSEVEAKEEEDLMLGKEALFIEHPSDGRNSNMKREYGDSYEKCLPWVDIHNFSAEKICGPHLWKLFKQAFIDGVKDPMARPRAADWEDALIKTSDMVLPCSNKKCSQKFFVFDNSKHPQCPFCGTPYNALLPVLNFYIKQKDNLYQSDGSRLLVWAGQSLFKWHVYKNFSPNEKLKPEDKPRVGYFQFFQGKWILFNEKIPDMFEIKDNKFHKINPGEFVILNDKTQILLSQDASGGNGRLAVVQLAGC